MIDETTLIQATSHEIQGWILYDDECPLCLDLVRRFDCMTQRAGFAMLPLQSATAEKLLAGRTDDLLKEMVVITTTGQMFGGGDAVLFLTGQFWWARPFRVLALIPGGRGICRKLYRWVAANRHCSGGTCGVRRSFMPRVLQVTAAILPLIVFAIIQDMEPWIVMWTLGAAILFSGKFLMLARYLRPGVSLRQLFCYLFLWVGMDPRPFLVPKTAQTDPLKWADYVGPAVKLIMGGLMLWIVVPAIGIDRPIAAGWAGMVGIILMLHFGTFHFLAFYWQRRGVRVQPLMTTPFRAPSLASFWGGRWNSAFNDVAKDLIYQSVWRRFGPAASILLVFLVSGIVHDIVISVPAEGGFGLPTLYFLIQGLGLLAERSRAGRRIGLARGIRGRIFLFAVLGAPLFWLFHPPFVNAVILPFLQTIHSL